MRLRLTTFGELALSAPTGVSAVAPRRKPLALLAVIAAHEPDGIARERVLMLLWPESTPDRARQTLSQTLYALRHDLGMSPVTGTSTLRLDSALVETDVDAFRHAIASGDVDQASSIARRPFLDGIAFPGCVEFDRWAEEFRARCDRSLARAMVDRARSASDAGQPDAAEHWRKAAFAQPLDSRLAREAAATMARAGDRAGAVQLLQTHVAALAEELAVRPDHETTTLIDELRSPLVPGRSSGSGAGPARRRPGAHDMPPSVVTASGATGSPEARPSRPARPWWRAAAVPVIIGAGAITVAATMSSRRESVVVAETERRLLIVPFSYHGPEDRAYLGAGVAEEIATRLAPLPGIQLLAPSAARGDRTATPIQSAKGLDAHYVLEGSVHSEGTGARSAVRVRSRLVSVPDGTVLWARTHDGDLADVLALQATTADSTARRIPIVLSAESSRRLHALPTTNPEAFDFYLRAGEYLRRGREGLPEARELLGQAIERDSSFALALARFGETQARMNWYGRDRDRTRMVRARQLIERAVSIDPFLPEAHLALGYWHLYDRRAYDVALAQMDTVLALSRNHAEALAARAQIRRRLGLWDGAAADFAAALAVDPRSYAVSLELGNTLLLMREYGRSREALMRAKALAPDAADPVAWLSALALRSSGDTATAAGILRQGLEQVDGHQLLARMLQTFPEVLRALPHDPFGAVSEVNLHHAYGDTASLHVMVAHLAREAMPAVARAHLDTARSMLIVRLQEDPGEYATHRRLADVLVRMGDAAGAVKYGRRAHELMPVSKDAMSGAAALLALAEAEIQAGELDSARVHVDELLRIPSALSENLVQVDPRWAALRATPGRRPKADRQR